MPTRVPVRSKLLDQIPNLVYGFGDFQSPIPEALLPFWNQCPTKRQVHGIQVNRATSDTKDLGDCDGVTTQIPGIPASIMTADCAPVLLAKKDGSQIAAIHAGWRGIYAGILTEWAKTVQLAGDSCKQWIAVIGPTVGPCCYEVDQQLALNFQERFENLSGLTPLDITPRPRHLALGKIIEAQLRSQHFIPTHIERVGSCTKCTIVGNTQNEFRFHSYRREGKGTRQYSGLVIKS